MAFLLRDRVEFFPAMKYPVLLAGLLLASGCAMSKSRARPDAIAASHPAYPTTKRDDVADTLHGQRVADPYRWLEDAKSPDVQSWMKAQDTLTRGWLTKLPLRDALVARFKQLFYIDTIASPEHRGAYYFYQRRLATQEKAVVYVRRGKQGEERVLLDPNAWSQDGSVSLGGWSPSWDGKRVAYTVHQNNSDEATMYLIEVATGKKSDVDVIEGAKYASASWTPSGDGFYYTWLPVDPSIPASERPGYAEVRFHKVGQDPKKDRIVHEKTGDATQFIGAGLSRDGHFLVLTIQHGWNSNDVYIRDLRGRKAASTEWTPFAVGKDATFDVDVWKDRFYMRTNEGAPKYAGYQVDPAHLDRAHWKLIVPEREDATLEGMGIVGGRLALNYLKDVASELEIRELDGRPVRKVELPGIGTVGGPQGNPDDDEAFYSFASFLYPTEIHSMSVSSGKTDLWAKLKVPVDPSLYTIEQVFCTSKDGTRVPMFVVHRKDVQLNGENPTLLYGYGGFQAALTPSFNSTIYPWLEHGGVYAVVNLRGGSEYGEAWHRAGMGAQKERVFEDFEAAAQTLVSKGFTKPAKLAIRGASNGGLLMGAALTRRPDLYRVVLCGVPLLDMLRYHRFGSGKTWVSEYGSAEDPAQFKTLFAYSPYHHVKAGTRYPSVLLLSADSDDRVDPMHARKFAAALQAGSMGGPVLLRIEQHAGHGGADLVRAAVEEYADEYAFALTQLGS
jgi:prolyl oligopeptidase